MRHHLGPAWSEPRSRRSCSPIGVGDRLRGDDGRRSPPLARPRRSRALAAPAPRSESGTGCARMTDAAPRHPLVLPEPRSHRPRSPIGVGDRLRGDDGRRSPPPARPRRSRALAAPAPRSESGTGCAGMTDAAPRHPLVLGLVIGRRGHSMAASGSYPRFFDLSRPDRALVRVLVVPAKARNLDPRAMGRRLPRQSPSPDPASALRTIRPPVGVPGKAP